MEVAAVVAVESMEPAESPLDARPWSLDGLRSDSGGWEARRERREDGADDGAGGRSGGVRQDGASAGREPGAGGSIVGKSSKSPDFLRSAERERLSGFTWR